MHWYLEVFRKYADFSGRARRKEYWTFFLFQVIFGFIFGLIDVAAGTYSRESGTGAFGTIYALVSFVPALAVTVRRFHDTDHSGWWMLVPIVNFVFAITDSQPGPNRYGPNPKQELALAPLTQSAAAGD